MKLALALATMTLIWNPFIDAGEFTSGHKLMSLSKKRKDAYKPITNPKSSIRNKMRIKKNIKLCLNEAIDSNSLDNFHTVGKLYDELLDHIESVKININNPKHPLNNKLKNKQELLRFIKYSKQEIVSEKIINSLRAYQLSTKKNR